MAELNYALTAFGFWPKQAEEYLAEERVKTANVMLKSKRLVLRYRPVGLVGVIGPWNYPLTNGFGDCVPALAAGNSVILKPSSVTPLTSLLLAEGLRECGLPENVLQVATGSGDTGRAVIDEADMIMFTGSTETGKKVMAQAAETVTPVSLELGGKDPLIVLSDADLERAANSAAYYGLFNTGQTCISVERVYVEAPVYDEFLGKLTEKVRALRNGPVHRPRDERDRARSPRRRRSTSSISTCVTRWTRARACWSAATGPSAPACGTSRRSWRTSTTPCSA